jgi:transcriptional regulator with XRE-family HTH domain
MKKRSNSDPMKGLILGKKKELRLKDEELADLIGVSRQTFSKMVNKLSTDDWKAGQLKEVCRGLGIPEADFFTAINYK